MMAGLLFRVLSLRDMHDRPQNTGQIFRSILTHYVSMTQSDNSWVSRCSYVLYSNTVCCLQLYTISVRPCFVADSRRRRRRNFSGGFKWKMIPPHKKWSWKTSPFLKWRPVCMIKISFQNEGRVSIFRHWKAK